MVAGIVLGSLVGMCALALFAPLGIRVVGGPDLRSWEWEVRYLLLRLGGPRRPKRPKAPKRKGKRERRRGKAGDGREGGRAREWVPLAPQLLRAAEEGLRFLLSHGKLFRLQLAGSIGAEDPATTGLLWGAIQALLRGLGPRGSRIEIEPAVRPDFFAGKTRLRMEAEGTVRLWVLPATVGVVLWHLPKRKLWRLLREQRRRPKARQGAGPKRNANLQNPKGVRAT